VRRPLFGSKRITSPSPLVIRNAPGCSVGATPQPAATQGRGQIGARGGIPERDQVAARRRDGDQAAAPVDRDAAAILAHLRLHLGRRLEQPDAIALMDADQRYAVAHVALILHGDRDAAGAEHRNVPDAELMALLGKTIVAPQRTVGQIEVGERGRHAVEVELGSVALGMGADAAVGNHQRGAIRHQQELVRPDAQLHQRDAATACRMFLSLDTSDTYHRYQAK
jgi:hypothetical protein